VIVVFRSDYKIGEESKMDLRVGAEGLYRTAWSLMDKGFRREYFNYNPPWSLMLSWLRGAL
jgi:hypothetical protein